MPAFQHFSISAFSASLRRFEVPLLLLAVLLGSMALTMVAPVYFRQDDVGYLGWAANAASPLQAFHPDTGTLFSMFRPTVNLWWMALYRVFELHPTGYQFLLAAAYGTALIFWWLAIKKLESTSFAVTTVVLPGLRAFTTCNTSSSGSVPSCTCFRFCS